MNNDFYTLNDQTSLYYNPILTGRGQNPPRIIFNNSAVWSSLLKLGEFSYFHLADYLVLLVFGTIGVISAKGRKKNSQNARRKVGGHYML